MTNRTLPQALAYIENQSHRGPAFREGECLGECQIAWGIGLGGQPSAAAEWDAAKFKHPTSDPNNIPEGALIHWSHPPYGHIAFAAAQSGWCWSTDINRIGFWDYVPITDIAAKWGADHVLVGWTEDLRGERVITYTPPKPEPIVTNVQTVRGALLAALNSGAARAIPPRRAYVRALLATIRTFVNRMPQK